jgi:hypothetical protein
MSAIALVPINGTRLVALRFEQGVLGDISVFAIIPRYTCLLGGGCDLLSCSGGLCRPEFGLVLHQRIGGARHAVGQGDHGLLGLLALDDFPQPVVPGLAAPR